MQCGQIERIWFEDDLFPAYPYLFEPTDESGSPTGGEYSKTLDKSPRSPVSTRDQASQFMVKSPLGMDGYETAVAD